jgi:hypothetical protein
VNILPRKEEDIPRGRHVFIRHGFHTHHQEGKKGLQILLKREKF